MQKTPLGVGEAYVRMDGTRRGPGGVAPRHSIAYKEVVGSELDSRTIPDTECGTATGETGSNPCFDGRSEAGEGKPDRVCSLSLSH